MFEDINSEVLAVTNRAKAIHSQERHITMESLKVVTELDALRAWFYLGMTVDQMALEVGLSPSMFYKRLKAAKIMDQYPEARSSFERGEIQISHIAMIGNRLTPANAAVIFEGIKNKSKREVEDFLARVSSNGILRDNDVIVEKTFRMTESQAALFERVLEVQACRGKVPTSVEALLRISEDYLNLNDPMRLAEKAAAREMMKKARMESDEENAVSRDNKEESASDENLSVAIALESKCISSVASEVSENSSSDEIMDLTPLQKIQANFRNRRRDPRKPIRAAVRHRVWLRDAGTCTFVHGNGERCKAKKMLEIDHLVMACRGGTNDESNLVLRCRMHNQFLAEMELGREFMSAKRKKGTLREQETK